jgi:hypothetical protein
MQKSAEVQADYPAVSISANISRKTTEYIACISMWTAASG